MRSFLMMSFFAKGMIDLIFIILFCSILSILVKIIDECIQAIPNLCSYFEIGRERIINRNQITPIQNIQDNKSYVIVVNPSNILTLGSYTKQNN